MEFAGGFVSEVDDDGATNDGDGCPTVAVPPGHVAWVAGSGGGDPAAVTEQATETPIAAAKTTAAHFGTRSRTVPIDPACSVIHRRCSMSSSSYSLPSLAGG
jgi:hypothetical protein